MREAPAVIPGAHGLRAFPLEQTAPGQRTQETDTYLGLYFAKRFGAEDVLPNEPAAFNDPLVAAWQANEPWILGRMLLNPRAEFYSPDAFVDLRRKAIETAYFYLRNGKLANSVNAEYLKRPR